MRTPSVLLIDCDDSFTANLAHALTEAGGSVVVSRAGRAFREPEESFTHLVLSPGPGGPADAGTALQALRWAEDRIPVLGVCLGHQVLALRHGLAVGRGPRPMHGTTSSLVHTGRGLFVGLPVRFRVARYHSLVVARPEASDVLTVDAETDDGAAEVMALRVRDRPIYGMQFHPESFLTEHGRALLAAFLRESAA